MTSKNWCGIACLLILSGAAPGLTQEVREKKLSEFKVVLPLTDALLMPAIRMWSAASGIPIGVEGRYPTKPPLRTESGGLFAVCDLTGMGIRESIVKMMKQSPQYRAGFDDDGMLILRPKKATALDRKVPRFTLTDASLVRAAEVVRQIFEPDYMHPATPIPTPTSFDTEQAKEYRDP